MPAHTIKSVASDRFLYTRSIPHAQQDFDRMCTTAGGIRFGVWVNVSLKGFRMKSVDFAAAGMSTDVPRPLSGASVAVRNVFVPYHFVRNNKNNSSSSCSGAGAVVGVEAGVDADGNPSSSSGTVSVCGTAQKVHTVSKCPAEDQKLVLGICGSKSISTRYLHADNVLAYLLDSER